MQEAPPNENQTDEEELPQLWPPVKRPLVLTLAAETNHVAGIAATQSRQLQNDGGTNW